MLFYDWLLEEGQQVLADKGLTPSVPTGDDPLKGVEVIPVDVEKLLSESDKWSKKYEAVVQGGEQVTAVGLAVGGPGPAGLPGT